MKAKDRAINDLVIANRILAKEEIVGRLWSYHNTKPG